MNDTNKHRFSTKNVCSACGVETKLEGGVQVYRLSRFDSWTSDPGPCRALGDGRAPSDLFEGGPLGGAPRGRAR